MKKIIFALLIIPNFCLADVKNIEMHNCSYNSSLNWVEVRAYNNNDKDIIYMEIKLTDPNGKNFTFAKNSKKTLIKAKNASKITFFNIFFKPKGCRIIDVKFKKGWFDFW